MVDFAPLANRSCYHMLNGLSRLLRPRNYLEVGPREGASLMAVLAHEPQVAIFAISTLVESSTRLTPELVRVFHQKFTMNPHLQQIVVADNWVQCPERANGDFLKQLAPNLEWTILNGESQTTLPRFFDANPNFVFDLVFVDGCHTDACVTADLTNLLGHFRVMVCHDLNHPEFPTLANVVTSFAAEHYFPMLEVGMKNWGTAVIFNLEG